MKVATRPTPLDTVSFSHKKHHVRIGTHRHKITVFIKRDNDVICDAEFTPEAFVRLMTEERP